MNQVILDFVAQDCLKARPQIRTGMRVKVTQKIKEGDKERLQSFEGLVIKTAKKSGINHTFTVRTVIGGVGVEKIFPLHADTIQDIEILKVNRVRRSRLYFMRDRSGKSARLKEIRVDLEKLNQKQEQKKVQLTSKQETTTESQPAE